MSVLHTYVHVCRVNINVYKVQPVHLPSKVPDIEDILPREVHHANVNAECVSLAIIIQCGWYTGTHAKDLLHTNIKIVHEYSDIRDCGDNATQHMQ